MSKLRGIKQMNRRARPRKQKAFLAALRETAVVTHAAQRAGVSALTVRNWRRNSDRFREECDEAMNEALDDLEAKAHELAKDGDGSMIRYILSRRRPEKWADKAKVDVSVEHRIPPPVIIVGADADGNLTDGGKLTAIEGVARELDD